MQCRTSEWDREKRYQEIWQKSTVQLAKEYGLPDVGPARFAKAQKFRRLD